MIPRYKHLIPDKKYIEFCLKMQVLARLNPKPYSFKHPSEWIPKNDIEKYCWNNLCRYYDIEILTSA